MKATDTKDRPKQKILFFINGPQVTDKARAKAIELEKANDNSVVYFRNGRAVGAEDKPEDCDMVCGLVPPQYEKAVGSDNVLFRTKAPAKQAAAANTTTTPAPANESNTPAPATPPATPPSETKKGK
jgi:hypothetical protein